MADFDLGSCVLGTNPYNGGTYSINDTNTGSPWVSGPAKIVTDHVTIAHNYASQAFDNTWCFLNGIATYAPTLNDLSSNVSFGDIDAPTPTFNAPDVPVLPTLDLTIPTFPSDFVPGDIHEFDENVIGTLPTLDALAPTVNLPPKPDELDATAPTDAPTIKDDFAYPDDLDVTLPTVPTFEELNIPTAPTYDLPAFELDVPALPADLTPPGLIFDFQEQAYSSTLYTALKDELLDRIQNGGTGLNADIEQAIWDRARNREDQNSVRSENQILVEQAARGFSRPSGAVLAALDQLAQETQNKNADLSREIAIKQAELEQRNIEFALQTSLALEQSFLQYHNQVQQRAFDTERFLQEAALALYDADIKKFGLQVEIYKVYADAFESRVRAELAKVEIFRSEIEAQKLIGDINVQYIELYKAQLQGIQTSVDVYKAEVDAIKTQIEAEGLKITNFRSLVDVFAAQVAAKKSEYDMYSSSVEGEMAKVSIYDSQVKAYVSRVDAYSRSVDAETKRIESDIEVEGLRLKQYLSKLEAIVQNVKAQTDVTNAQVDVFRGEAEMYKAEVGAESSRLDAETRIYDLEIRQKQYEAEIELKNAEINIANAANSVKLLLEALQSGAQVGSSLSAASLSAMNIGASISGSSQDIHTYDEK